jgi:general secretion pathway protein J
MFKSPNGFTLLELVLAIGLLALVATVVYGSFRATVDAMERATASGAPARQARVTLARLADELAAADWAPNRPETLFVGSSGELEGRPADLLEFTSRSHVWYPTQPPAIEQAMISYTVDRSSPPITSPITGDRLAGVPRLQLWREEQANPFLISGGGERLLMAEGLAGVEFRFYSKGEWRDEWSASDERALPELVEVVLTFEGVGGREEEFRTLVALPAGGA